MDATVHSTTVNSNLTIPQSFSYKDILVGKLVLCVACSVISQIVILLIYVFVANVNILYPSSWLYSIVEIFTHASTWIFLIIVSFIVFAQCLICAKDYILMITYSSTRFQKFLHVFSLHNFILLAIHMIVGGAFTWQILIIINSVNKSLTEICNGRTCLVEDSLFLIVGGVWTGLYFFVKVYISSKQVVFPVIQQRKFLRFKSNVILIFKGSLTKSLWTTIYFVIFYQLWGAQFENYIGYIAGLSRTPRESSILIYVYLWWFSTLYFFNMNLMRFFFYMFLTESVPFPLVKEHVYMLTLQEALLLDNLPIIQNLACLDLFLLAQWSPLRRQQFFSLSQPGGHPHNWNGLVESVMKVISEYTDLLKKSTEIINPQDLLKKQPVIAAFSTTQLQTPKEQNVKYRNLRNMSLHQDYIDVVDVSHQTLSSSTADSIKQKVDKKIEKLVNFIKIFFGINFFFGPLSEVNIQKCLGNGQLIIWISQGISELVVKSLTEDKFGIVQKDMHLIINSLVSLKQNLDKLNKMPTLSRKIATLDDFNYKMKNAIVAAVKRSLYDICLHFGNYFNDLPLSKDVLYYLQTNIMLKNTS